MSNAHEAAELLAQADRAASSARAGASWPLIATLMAIGGSSSLGLLAVALMPKEKGVMLMVPMGLMLGWIIAALVFGLLFSRSTKHGFSKRWVITITAWSVAWMIGILGVNGFAAGQLWFAGLMGFVIMAVTLVGATIEARS